MAIRLHSITASIWFTALIAAPPGFAQAQNVDAGSVSATGAVPRSGSEGDKLKPAAIFKSGQPIKDLNKAQIQAAGPAGGAAQALALAPGVNVATYGSSGSSKSSISINGIKAGWAGFSGGNVDNGSVGVSFDGVPMVNPGNGLWQATLVPQNSIIDGIGVTYGPGNPLDRWYTTIGGSIAFNPLQPSDKRSASIDGTYGSFNTKNIDFNVQSGDINGWETVFAGGIGSNDSFLRAPDGFNNGANNYAYYFKTRKTFSNGDFSIGGYIARSAAYRPLAIPVQPIADVETGGYQSGTPLFSQATSGYYTTLARAVNNKIDDNQIQLVYARLNIDVSAITSFHNLTYFTHEARLHFTTLHNYIPGGTGQEENNNPYSYVLGDKAWFATQLPFNAITYGGFIQTSKYRSQEDLYNPALPVGASNIPGSASIPNGNYFSDIFRQLDSAVFVQDTITPLPGLRITPGLRFINYATDFSPNEANAFPLAYQLNPGTDQSFFGPASKTFSRIEPSIEANYKILPWLAGFASFARAYRQPENGGGTGPYVAIAANHVQLEQGDYVQGGFKMHWDQIGSSRDINASVNAFHLNFSNETLPTALASGGSLLASGSSIYNGVNIAAEASPIYQLYLFANGSIEHAYFRHFTNGNGSFSGVPVAYVPDITFNAGAYYKYLLHNILIEPRVTYQYTGSQHVYDDNLNITSTQRQAPFGLVNLSLSADVPVGGAFGGTLKTIKLTGNVENVLGLKYEAFQYISAGGLYGTGAGATLALPGPGRAFYVTVGASF
ncbi:MAG TPA: TonB-dependent receptor [Acetobacteraceae bacterium]|nr:TonB-dependent receptor [Acetobacteraceae bacterium]